MSIRTIAAGLALLLCCLSLQAQETGTGTADLQNRVLTVFHFVNTRASEEDQWMSRAFADGLNTRLASSGITLVEREDLEKVLKEQKLGLAGITDDSTALELGKILNATDLVQGSYIVLDGRIKADVRVTDSEKGEILFAVSKEATLAEYFDLESSLALSLGGYYGFAPGDKGVSSSRDALRLYYKGLVSLDEQAYERASDAFTAALALDPEFLAPRDSLEDSYRFLKEFRKARYQREVNVLYRRLKNLLDRAYAEPFVNWADQLTEAAMAGHNVTVITNMAQENPEMTWGTTKAEVLWHAQNVMLEIADYSLEHFDDEEEASRMFDRVIAVSRTAQVEMKDDPFLPELIYQELLTRYYMDDWDTMITLCETLMFGWPDYRMMWAIEDFYETAVEELENFQD
ncbi:MAG: CsgG/HfaB family protein [Spirochaetales bacterium]|nr:CsgG/HfaB family protein [Spirochaetales bacterium]